MVQTRPHLVIMRIWIKHCWAITCKQTCHQASDHQRAHRKMLPETGWMHPATVQSARWDQNELHPCQMANGMKLEVTQLRNTIRKLSKSLLEALQTIYSLISIRTAVNSLAHTIIDSTTVACWMQIANQSLKRSTKCTANVSLTNRLCHRHPYIHIHPSALTCHRSLMCHWSTNHMSHTQSPPTTWMEQLRLRQSSNHQHRWWNRKWSTRTQLTSRTTVTWRAEAAMGMHLMKWLITITLTLCHIPVRWTAMEPRRDHKRAIRRWRRVKTNTWRGMRSEPAPCTFRSQ